MQYRNLKKVYQTKIFVVLKIFLFKYALTKNRFFFKLVKKRRISCIKSQNKIKEYINELNDYLKTYQADHEVMNHYYFYQIFIVGDIKVVKKW